jgi:SH3 domain protein
MTRTLTTLGLVLVSTLVHAQSDGRTQYITDDIDVTLRDGARNDAAAIGSVRSGESVVVLHSLGPASFARIRKSDGTVGWITARYLSDEPAARTKLNDLQSRLDEANARIRTLDNELKQAQQQIEKAKPALELARENDDLRRSLQLAQQQSDAAQSRYDVERARRRTLVTGASLVGGGVLLGLILPWLGATRRRRRSDF